jgi:ATP-dependent helicase HrpA
LALPSDLDRRISHALHWDQHRLTRASRGLEQLQKQGKPTEAPLQKLLADIEKSARIREQRLRDVPKIQYDAELPITARKDEILVAIREHQVIVVCGETGSGKSTQLPKICLEAGRGVAGMIGHTQPRRIAARSVAARVAEELDVKLGQQVGYKIRFNDVSSPRTLIKLMTDGILLAETQNDRYLDRYDTIIIDEAHERSLNIDFLMGYIKRILPKRPDLRVIITSATIDAVRFAGFFEGSLRVEGLGLRDSKVAGFSEASGATPGASPSSEEGSSLLKAPSLGHTQSLDSESPATFSDRHLPGLSASAATLTPNPSPGRRGEPEVFSGHSTSAISHQPPNDQEPRTKNSSAPQPSTLNSHPCPCPVLLVSGRTYPVEVRYRPPVVEDEDEIDLPALVGDAVDELSSEGNGDILVFLPTEQEIREVAKTLGGRGRRGEPVDILPLYGRLSEAEQNRIFQPSKSRRIVLATNVAESSLTVPGIHYVVDTGTARISRYAPQSKVQRLPIEAISRASADQRKGRCGRIAPGICIRLYSERDFSEREAYTPPEILRTNLASVILQTKALQLGHLADFPLLDPPPASAIRSGERTLFELGAIDENDKLTPIGKTLSQWPVDPGVSRMILAADEEQCLEEVLIIAAALEIRDPRERPVEKQQAADQAHAKFADERSDYMSFLKLWDFARDQEEKLSRGQFQKACRQNFLSSLRIREWYDLTRQLKQLAEEHGLQMRPRKNNAEAIHRAILAGLLSNIALKGEKNDYTGAGNQQLNLWPGSVAFKTKPRWIVAAELVETTKRYARVIAPVDPMWIERLAVHLVKRNYSDAAWESRSGAVMATERVLLFGLPVVTGRRVRYSSVEPELCRKLLIEHVLIQGDYQGPELFHRHNAGLKEELSDWQAKLRQSQLFASEEAQFAFFDSQVPKDVCDVHALRKWLKSVEKTQPHALCLTREVLLDNPDVAMPEHAFPDELAVGKLNLPVEYALDPGQESDGLTITVPRAGIGQLSAERLNWLVPGLLEEKIAALIKSLPKELRRLFVPVGDVVNQIKGDLKYGEGSLTEQLAAALRRVSGEHVPVTAFEEARVPDHLRINIRMVDDEGAVIQESRDLAQLQRGVRSTVASSPATISEKQWSREGITDWTDFDLPAEITINRGGIDVRAFPMLVDRGEAVALSLSMDAAHAERETRRALVRLLLIAESKRVKEQVDWIPRFQQICVFAMTLPDHKEFKQHAQWRLAERALAFDGPLPRNSTQWRETLKRARGQMTIAVQELSKLLEPLMVAYHQTRKVINQQTGSALQYAIDDTRSQLEALFAAGFLSHAPWPWLAQYPRYLQAIQMRWQKITSGGSQKDRSAFGTIAPHWDRWKQTVQRNTGRADFDPFTPQVRWLIEESRVAAFAQSLGLGVAVSEQKIQAAWAAMSSAV